MAHRATRGRRPGAGGRHGWHRGRVVLRQGRENRPASRPDPPAVRTTCAPHLPSVRGDQVRPTWHAARRAARGFGGGSESGAGGERVSVQIAVPTADDMRELGKRLATLLRAGDLVVLTGSLGAGKT